ncbi:asparagine synthase C-terminal domain-containing protein [Caulobacter segnis]|uniref:Asparagine synthase n=1 Tax=Caulobacter segnis TaxID=88688 RepID=A0A2W5V269_9CAUL|nr:asparagine synthase C-terminal domain-containing protein [Caulobacter segnis]PZR34099.1 MAG: asparagine synthase [Caulobacter segnis]
MGYLVLVRAPGDADTAFEAMLAELTGQQGWRRALEAYGLAVLVKGVVTPEVHGLQGAGGVGGVVLGTVFDRAASASGEVRRADLRGLIDAEPLEAASRLIEGAWGGYVAIMARRREEPPAVLRDPTGQLDAFVWARDGVTLIGSEAPFGCAAPVGLAIDWPRLGDLLDDPRRTGAAPPLLGLVAVDPGECRYGQAGRESARLWSPRAFARAPRASAGLLEDLRRCVDISVAAAADRDEALLCEISGGLDSAIVATTLARLGLRPAGAINFYRDQPEGDERRWAQAVADATGTPLCAVRRAPFALDQAAFDFGAAGVRPSLNALDPDYDRLLLEEVERLKAQVLLTGHGGDVVFYQLGAAELAADLLRGQPCDGSRLARLGDIARRTRRSVWSLARQAVLGAPVARRSAEQERFIRPVARAAAHPWLSDLAGVSPAKRVQVAGLVNSLNVVARTRRGEATRLAHPLLSQPMIELCLSIPATLLSAGEDERTLARQAFADRLPRLVAERRSKGDITAFFGRSVAASLPVLRERLLDGRLVARGLIDRERLELALRPETLVWKDFYGEILVAAALEAWVGHWEGRINDSASAGRAALSGDGCERAVSRKAKARR